MFLTNQNIFKSIINETTVYKYKKLPTNSDVVKAKYKFNNITVQFSQMKKGKAEMIFGIEKGGFIDVSVLTNEGDVRNIVYTLSDIIIDFFKRNKDIKELYIEGFLTDEEKKEKIKVGKRTKIYLYLLDKYLPKDNFIINYNDGNNYFTINYLQ